MPWPRVRQFPSNVRRAILQRDRTCQHCHDADATIADHIVPLAEGGANTADNGQGMCRSCHTRKTLLETKRGHERWNQSRERQRRDRERHPGIVD